jgi:hypothetical protein
MRGRTPDEFILKPKDEAFLHRLLRDGQTSLKIARARGGQKSGAPGAMAWSTKARHAGESAKTNGDCDRNAIVR